MGKLPPAMTKDQETDLVTLILSNKKQIEIKKYFRERYNIILTRETITQYKISGQYADLREEVGKKVTSELPYAALGNIIKQLREIKKHIDKLDAIIDQIIEGKIKSVKRIQKMKGRMKDGKLVASTTDKVLVKMIEDHKLEAITPLLQLKREYLNDAIFLTKQINNEIALEGGVSFSFNDLYRQIDKIDDSLLIENT